jgi:predicted dehydrogenase
MTWLTHNSPYSRRKFLSNISSGLLSFNGIAAFSACGQNDRSMKEEELETRSRQTGKLGIALVGLGRYATGQLAPALQQTTKCYLAGIVTGTPQKAKDWKKRYAIPDKNTYDYKSFDKLKDNPDIDIVYVVLPNAMHAEYVIRAAKAGKHVICEKPMATSVEDCNRMIAACKQANRMLSIGYRLHFEPYNREMMRLGKEKVFGDIQSVVANNGMDGTEGWRLDKELAGGGPLMDVGIYCVQGARYTTGLEPIAVTAQELPKTKPEIFTEVEEALTWQMEFPGAITASCTSSYSKYLNLLRVVAEKGWYELSPAFGYSGQKGATSEGKMNFPKVNQQARQMDDFADAILNKRPTPVPGEMGRQDVKILMAIYEAMRSGKKVEIAAD